MSTYLSPFDAPIDAAFVSSPGCQYHAIHAAEFAPRGLIQDNRGDLHYFLHFGWGASDGKLVVRRKGNLVGLCGLDTLHIPPESMSAIDLKIDRQDRDRYNHMREAAGLFAHAECHNDVLMLRERERMQHVARAIEAIPGTVPVTGANINQAAMYDFEAAQWHFVPIDAFTSHANHDQEQP